MKNMLSREKGSSMIEMTLVVSLISLVSLTALPNLRDKIECRFFVGQIAVADPVQKNADGSQKADMEIPRSCVIEYLGFDPQEKVRFTSLWTSPSDPGTWSLTTLDGKVLASGVNQGGMFGQKQG
jgi:Flp pilus assembly pilin Flp